MTDETPLRIIELRANNVKKISAVHIRPNGSLVVIGGKNAAGKSSVLDSIAYALGGKSLMPEQPLRKGAHRGSVSIDLGELRVTRTFTRGGGGTLRVEDREGVEKRSPQRLLDALYGKLTFDPLAFLRMKAADQVEALRELVGLDFRELDDKRAAAYEQRTEANRELRRLEAALEQHGPPRPQAQEVDVSAVLAELAEAERLALEREAHVRELEAIHARVSEHDVELERLKRAISQVLEARQAEAERLAQVRYRIEVIDGEAQDVAALRQRLRESEEQNRAVAHNRKIDELEAAAGEAGGIVEALTDHIGEIDQRKREKVANAAFPVEGLGFDDSGPLLNGLPFSQASQAEQLRVSVAMGFATHPRLRIALIRDGSLLDEDSLALVAQLTEEQQGQTFIERVGRDEATTVLIEDGHAAEGSDVVEEPNGLADRGDRGPDADAMPGEADRVPDTGDVPGERRGGVGLPDDVAGGPGGPDAGGLPFD